MPRALYPDAETIRRNYGDPVFTGLRQELEAIDLEAGRRFLDSEVRLNDYADDLSKVAFLAEQMTFLHLGSGRDEPSELAVQAIEKLMEYSKWDYFEEGGRIPIGIMRAPVGNRVVSLVCEYLGDRLTPETRTRWIRGMVSRGIELCFNGLQGMRYPDQVEGWSFDPESTYLKSRPEHRDLSLSNWPRIFNENNLRAVPTNGLLTGAVVYLREFGSDDDTDRWLEQARHSFATLGGLYASDGAYDEGVSYSDFTSGQMVDLIRHFEWLEDSDHFDCVNWRGNAKFLLGMSAPTTNDPARVVTFSDGPTAPRPAVSMWLAGRLMDPVIQWYALNRTSPARPRALLCYEPSLEARQPEPGPSLLRTSFDWIVARGGHQAEDLVCAMRSGPPSNHEHADRNSIVVKCFGEQLLPDPAPTPYSYVDPSWAMRFTEGHNAILIDGKGHQYVDGSEGTNASEARAQLIDVTEGPDFVRWTSDATQAYQLVIPDAASVVRTLFLVPGFPLVVVADKVIKTRQASTLQARFFGFNEDGHAVLTACERGFTITRPLARLEAQVFSESEPTFTTGRLPIADEKAEAYPYIEVSTMESLEPGLVTILMPVQTDHETPSVKSKKASAHSYEFTVTSGHGTVALTVDLAGRVPRIDLCRPDHPLDDQDRG